MKFVSRRVAAAVLAAVLLLPVAPVALGNPRDGVDASEKIVRIIKKLQKLFGITVQSDPLPPRP